MPEKGKAAVIELFKHCTCCPAQWQTRDDFLSDPDVKLVGYQAHFEDLKAGLLLFNHACRTTLAIEVECFQDLYDGPVFQDRPIRGKNCPGYCLHQKELRPCRVKCECAYVREILQLVLKWKKRQAA